MQRLLLVVRIVVRRGGEFDIVFAVVVLRLLLRQLLLLRVQLLLLHLLLLLGTRIIAWKVAASWAASTPVSTITVRKGRGRGNGIGGTLKAFLADRLAGGCISDSGGI